MFLKPYYMEEEFEDTKCVIRICKSKKDRQHNGQKKNKKTNSDLQSITDRVTPTPLKTAAELCVIVSNYCTA
jgi:hypothetical protein